MHYIIGIVAGVLLGFGISKGASFKTKRGIILASIIIPVIISFIVAYIGTEIIEYPRHYSYGDYLTSSSRERLLPTFEQQLGYSYGTTLAYYALGYIALGITFGRDQMERLKKTKENTEA
jgi:hypothetical protein